MKKPAYLTKVKTTTILVTPQHAEKWLGRMRRNRNLSESVVNSYCRDLERGNWPLTHQGIAFDQDDYLIDGQHRLWAISLTGKSAWMQVTRGLPTGLLNGSGMTIMDVVDNGRVRSVGQQFQIQHGIKNANNAAAACRALAIACAPWVSKVSTAESIQIHNMLADNLQQFISMAVGSRPKIGNSAAVAALAFASTKRDVSEFAHQLYFGENVRRGLPAYQLRSFLLGKMNVTRQKSSEIFMKTTCTALRAHFDNREITKLYASDGAVELILSLNPELQKRIAALFPRFEKSARAASR